MVKTLDHPPVPTKAAPVLLPEARMANELAQRGQRALEAQHRRLEAIDAQIQQLIRLRAMETPGFSRGEETRASLGSWLTSE